MQAYSPLCALLDESTRALDLFSTANELWAEGLRGILQMVTRRGLIDVDFADLAAVLRGRNAQSCFASVETSGETRSREAIEKLLAHPLLDEGRALAEADALLVTMTGGPGTTRAVHALTDIAPIIEAGRFELPVAETFPLDQIGEAHRVSERGHVRGKLVVLVDRPA